jgi:crotonobetainyl-CoA:carnitine CoA-transferase CaiB-like acyl-CoA transferase
VAGKGQVLRFERGDARIDPRQRLRYGCLDLIAQGIGGIGHVTGEPDRRRPRSVCRSAASATACGQSAVMFAALYERQRTGKGRLGECSLLETAVGFGSWTSAQWLADHQEPIWQCPRHRQNVPYRRVWKNDGYLVLDASERGFAPASNCGRS